MNKNFKHILLKNLSEELKQIRLKKGLSQTDVALQTNISLQNLHLIEEGENLAFRKYMHLLHFYGKEIRFVLKDRI